MPPYPTPPQTPPPNPPPYPMPPPKPPPPECGAAGVPLLIDTDMSIDVDDVGALCAAHALADRCETRLLAMVHDTGLGAGAAALSLINEYYGRGDLPIGSYTGVVGDPTLTTEPQWTSHGRGVYVDYLVERWPQGAATFGPQASAVRVMRDALGSAEDGSVVLASIGFATNIRQLLLSESGSGGDSLPSGVELVRAKVRHMVMMGGRARPDWRRNPPEWNFAGCGRGCGPYAALPAITNATLRAWPPSVPLSFIGFEAGVDVQTGGDSLGYSRGAVSHR